MTEQLLDLLRDVFTDCVEARNSMAVAGREVDLQAKNASEKEREDWRVLVAKINQCSNTVNDLINQCSDMLTHAEHMLGEDD
jgi:ribosomal protein L16 Arg81 hydroxylase